MWLLVACRPCVDTCVYGLIVLMADRLRALFLCRVLWASMEVGLTTHAPDKLEFPPTMTNMTSGTWMISGKGVIRNRSNIKRNLSFDLDSLTVSTHSIYTVPYSFMAVKVTHVRYHCNAVLVIILSLAILGGAESWSHEKRRRCWCCLLMERRSK